MSIQHTVVFRLPYAPGSTDELAFLAAARDALIPIPGVIDFTVSRQVSPKSDFTWQFSMSFSDQAAYDAYNVHPDHVAFVATRWIPEVSAFQEYDFVVSPAA